MSNTLEDHVKMLEEALSKYERLAINLAQQIVDRDALIANHAETIENHKIDLAGLADRILKSISGFSDKVVPLDGGTQTPQPVPGSDPAATNVL